MNIVHRQGDLDLDRFLQRPLFAHLATASPNGPRSSPVWFLWEDAALWIIANLATDTFPKRIQAEPKCALSIVDFDPIAAKVHHIGFRGRADIAPWCEARAKRKLRRYLGENEAAWDPTLFTLDAAAKPLAIVKFTPESAVVRDQSYRSALLQLP